MLINKKEVSFDEAIKFSNHDNVLLKMAFLIVDIRHEPTEDDCLMYEYLKHFNIPTTIVATKADKIGKTLIQRHLKIIKQKLNFSNDDKIYAFSSETKFGIEQIESLIEELSK